MGAGEVAYNFGVPYDERCLTFLTQVTKGLDNMMKKMPVAQDFILNTVLYKEFKVDTKRCEGLENFNESIDVFCVDCQQASVFVRRNFKPVPTEADRPAFVPGQMSNRTSTESSHFVYFIDMEFACSRDRTHVAKFVFRVCDGSIAKIGEYPSMADREFPEIKKYANELGRFSRELRSAIQLYSHGVGVGSFVYLRRVLEKIIQDVAQEKYSEQVGWDFENWRKTKRDFGEVVGDLSDHLPKLFVNNAQLWGILSKGIHALSEEECLDYFESVKMATEIILDERIKVKQDKKRERLIIKQVSEIGMKLKKR